MSKGKVVMAAVADVVGEDRCAQGEAVRGVEENMREERESKS